MDFADEHYVKLFTRDTPTRLMWPWEAIALHPNLLRKLDKAGVLELGTRDTMRRLAVSVGLPLEVVEPGLAALLEDGTVELVEGRVVVPKFLEAQESRKTDATKARDYRARKRDKARANSTGLLDPTVTDRHRASPTVTDRHTALPSSPAQPSPSPAQPERTAGAKRKRAERPPDPRHAPLVLELVNVFQRETGAKYPFGPIDAAAVTALLGKGLEPTIVAAWTKALRSSSYPLVRTLSELVRHLAHFVGQTGPPSVAEANQQRAESHRVVGDIAPP